MPQNRRPPSERDAERRVAVALEQRGFTVYQNVTVEGAGRRGDGSNYGFVDIFAERGDEGLIVEMKRPADFRSGTQRRRATAQAIRYADRLAAVYVATSDGNALELTHDGKNYIHQLVDGLLLLPSTDRSPLDLGADYLTFVEFPTNQRARYERATRVVIPRDGIVDLPEILHNRACDVLLISGEAGAGKTMYGRQLSLLPCWDPLWLDGSLIGEPRSAIDEAVNDLTGFTGDAMTFLKILQGYRKRDGGAPCGIIIDSIDEWQNAGQYLHDMLHLAKTTGIFVVGFGRARSIDLLVNDDRLSQFTIQRGELIAFNDDERIRASAAYIAAYDLKSGFRGHAEEMSRLPEMMALISETYASEEINPDLTEGELYERYRTKKSQDVARRADLEPARVQTEIDDVAFQMLRNNSVMLSFREASSAAPHLDNLLVSGILLQEGPVRDRRLRFRFGRIRDDALSTQPPAALFEQSIVGRSALDYRSATDITARRSYLRLSFTESIVDSVALAREYDWWDLLAELLPGSLSPGEQEYVLRSAQAVLARTPRLVEALSGAPRAPLFARMNDVVVNRDLWRRWLDAAESVDDLHDILDLTIPLFSHGAIGLSDATSAVSLVHARLLERNGDFNDSASFWRLAAIACEGTEPKSASRLLRSLIPMKAIASSSSRTMMGSFYHGISYGAEMIKTVEVLRLRLSPRAFEAWACTTLVQAHVRHWSDFDYDGREISGSASIDGTYGDNGWVINVILPAEKAVIDAGYGLVDRVARYRISRLHPAFRLRALLLAAPIEDFARLETTMLDWRKDRNTGIPPLATVLDSRANESEPIAEQSLNDALERFHMPISAAQGKLFHKRLAAGDRQAMQLARQFIASTDFRNTDLFNVNFFDDLDWASSKPLLAGELVRIALLNGWGRLQLSMQRGFKDVLRLALTRPRLRALLSDVPDIEDLLADALHGQSKALRARQIPLLYDQISERSKRNLILTAHELPRAAAISLVRRAFRDELFAADNFDDSSIDHNTISSNSFAGDVWSALVFCSQKWPKNFFIAFEIDVIEQALSLRSPGAIASSIMPLVNYVFANRKKTAIVSFAIDSLLELGLRGGPKLRALTADRIGQLYGYMTEPQRTRFLDNYADTAQVATAAFYIARFKSGDNVAIERASEKAQTSPHRNQIAGVLWRELSHKNRSLTSFERTIVGTLIQYADEPALREVEHVAVYLSLSDPADATATLLAIVKRALHLRIALWQAFEMRYDWHEVDLATLAAVAREASQTPTLGWVEVDIIGRGLESRTRSEDAAEVQQLFEALISRNQNIREHFARWRRATARN